jgi:hypothetical protein
MAKTRLVAQLWISENVFWIYIEESTLSEKENVIWEYAMDCGFENTKP